MNRIDNINALTLVSSSEFFLKSRTASRFQVCMLPLYICASEAGALRLMCTVELLHGTYFWFLSTSIGRTYCSYSRYSIQHTHTHMRFSPYLIAIALRRPLYYTNNRCTHRLFISTRIQHIYTTSTTTTEQIEKTRRTMCAYPSCVITTIQFICNEYELCTRRTHTHTAHIFLHTISYRVCSVVVARAGEPNRPSARIDAESM